MGTQRYENHAYQPVATIVGAVFLLVSIAGLVLQYFRVLGGFGRALVSAGLIGAISALLYISRVYTTRLQDRIIRLEMRVRAATILTAEQQRALAGLDNKRIAALRFAPDEELPFLLEKTVKESLAPRDIKRAVRNWVPDNQRT
jgi:hypothetical protein